MQISLANHSWARGVNKQKSRAKIIARRCRTERKEKNHKSRDATVILMGLNDAPMTCLETLMASKLNRYAPGRTQIPFGNFFRFLFNHEEFSVAMRPLTAADSRFL